MLFHFYSYENDNSLAFWDNIFNLQSVTVVTGRLQDYSTSPLCLNGFSLRALTFSGSPKTYLEMSEAPKTWMKMCQFHLIKYYNKQILSLSHLILYWRTFCSTDYIMKIYLWEYHTQSIENLFCDTNWMKTTAEIQDALYVQKSCPHSLSVIFFPPYTYVHTNYSPVLLPTGSTNFP